MKWIENVFEIKKPIIAMCHLQAMPGDPNYNSEKGMDYVVEMARKDLLALQDGGVDAVMFSNEFSLPYLTKVPTGTTAAMARIIGELKRDIKVPYGVNVLWDPIASIASDFGLWNTNVGETVRHKHHMSAKNVKLLFNIVPEAARYLGNRDICEIAKTTVFNNRPDALCVSGLTAGAETDTQILSLVKKTVPDTAVFCNTGCRLENIEQQLSVADGAVVGTTFKIDGKFENGVDQSRVKEFMDKVKSFRPSLVATV